MEFRRVNREDPERFFMTVRNSYSTATITNGQWVGHDIVTDKDGASVTKISGVIRSAVAGCAIESIPHGEYGLVQVWGYKADARCLGGSLTAASRMVAGRPLYFATSGFAARGMERNSTAIRADYGKFPCGIVIEPLNTSALVSQAGTSGAYEVFIRCF